ncbi:MAG: 23S rRNA (adenine(2503)-C(2))-methyltransferase RlmN, partial [Sulfurimonas sp.]
MKPTILDKTKAELSQEISPSFRAKQIFQWLYTQYVDDFDAMKNLPQTMRHMLCNRYDLMPLTLLKKEHSSDGTIKY